MAFYLQERLLAVAALAVVVAGALGGLGGLQRGARLVPTRLPIGLALLLVRVRVLETQVFTLETKY